MSAADPVSLTLAVCFDEGLALLEAQAWQPASECFSRGLAIDPSRTGLWHNRAWCQLQLGDLSAARADLEELIVRAPGHAQGLALLGRVHLAQGAPEEGIALLERAWLADPQDAAIARQALQALLLRPEDEVRALERARQLAAPGQLDRESLRQVQSMFAATPTGRAGLRQLWAQLCTGAHCEPWMFGVWVDLCQRDRCFDEAALAATLWLRREPDNDQARQAILWAHAGRGDLAALLPLAIERARASPHDVEAMVQLAVLLIETRNRSHRDAGLQVLAHALTLSPTDPRPWLLRGHCFAKRFLHEDALADFRLALRLDPGLTAARVGVIRSLAALGRHPQAREELAAFGATGAQSRLEREAAGAFLLRTEGQIDEAESRLQGCVASGDPTARWELGSLLLLQGRYAQGWSLWRSLTHDGRPRPLWHRLLVHGARPWDGDLDKLAGHTLAVVSDTGLGDALQFGRFLPALQARGATVLLFVQDAVRGLLGRIAGIRVRDVEDTESLPPVDWVCSLWDLPMLLDVRLDDLDRWGPAHYLRQGEAQAARNDMPASSSPALRVALGWRGNRSPLAERSIALEQIADLRIPGVAWFSLQQELRPGVEAQAAQRMGLHHEGWSLDQSARAMAQVDLVVSVDTVLCHLAGSLGLPTLVLLPLACDWRWGARASRTPWYPRTRLLRQQRSGDWRKPLSELAFALREQAAGLR